MSAVVAPKRAVEELAVFTGQPAFASPFHVGTPSAAGGEAFLARARDILERRWFTNDGPYVQALERRIGEQTGVAHCIVVANGTLALELAFRAADLRGEVILPAFTFVATAHALLWQGLTPVFCDIDPGTHNLDPAHVAALTTPRTSAIVGVHVWGRPAYDDELEQLAAKHGLRLFFDAAHAVGCTHEGRPIGGRGDAEILSFHATKVIHSFEGGAILTNDSDLAQRIRPLRNFGFADYDDVRTLGVNAKLPEMSAAMGLTTLERLDSIIAANRRNWETYRSELSGLPGVALVSYDEAESHNYHYVVLELDPGRCSLARDDLVRVLHAENVLARRYFYPGCHRMEPYRSLVPGLSLPATEAVAARVVTLPTGDSLDKADIAAVAGIVRLAVENAASLPAMLPELRRPAAPGFADALTAGCSGRPRAGSRTEDRPAAARRGRRIPALGCVRRARGSRRRRSCPARSGRDRSEGPRRCP
jgi:dTDP-4-amino-4,6-dideoxygalactose transaminase